MSFSRKATAAAPPPGSSRERAVFSSMVMGLVNLVPRIAVALISGSVTLYTDALRSATETLASFCSWQAVRKIARGGQDGYEYGLGKLENLISILIVLATLVTVALMGFNSVFRLIHPQAVHRLGLGLVVSCLSGVVSWLLWRKSLRAARAEPSPLMESHWRLMRNKFLGNLCVIATLVLSMAFQGQPWVVYVDPLGSLILCAFICLSLYGMLAGAVSALLDKALDEKLQMVILRHLAAFEARYEQLHGIRTRRSGSDVFIELFLQFDGRKLMAEVQADMDSMASALEKDIPNSHVILISARCPPGASRTGPPN